MIYLVDKLWREALGEVIREYRTDHGDRLQDLADRAGISWQYLSEIERGLKDPSSEVFEAVSQALGLTVPEVARGAAERILPTAEPPQTLALAA